MIGSPRLRAVVLGALLITLLWSAPSYGQIAESRHVPASGEVDVGGDDPKENGVASYTKLWNLFQAEPEAWGDAYFDGDTLVVNSVTRTVDEAAAVLAEHGVTDGVVIRQVQYSIADYERAMDALSAAREFRGKITSMGPDYSSGRLEVDVAAGSGVTVGDVRAVLDRAASADGSAMPPVVVGRGWFGHLDSSITSSLESATTSPWVWLIAATAVAGFGMAVWWRSRRAAAS